jgi:uncharacterized membrane protein YhaH (DUF805 family)
MRHINRLLHILTDFRGGIDRQAFWIGILVVAAAYLLSPFRPPSVDGFAGAPTIASEVWSYLWLMPLAAVVVKRVNDIGWPSWLGYAFVAVVGLSFIPWSIGLLPARPGEMTPIGTLALNAYLLLWLVAFLALVFVPGNWRPGRYAEQAFLRRAGVAVTAEPPVKQRPPRPRPN